MHMNTIFTPGGVYEFTYTNHEQKQEKRLVVFKSLGHGEYPFHTHRCWVMHAVCLDRRQPRTFELGRIADDIKQIA